VRRQLRGDAIGLVPGDNFFCGHDVSDFGGD